MSDTNEQRVHPATPRRRQLARSAGQVAVSRELVSATTMLTAVGCFVVVGPPLARYLLDLTTRHFQVQVAMAPAASWHNQVQEILFRCGQITAPALIAMIAVPLLVHLLQTGFHFRMANMTPDLNRVSPAAGFQKMASGDRWAQSGLATAKILVVLGIALAFLYVRRDQLMGIIQLEVHQLGSSIFRQLLQLVIAAIVILAGVAVLDYLLQRWKLERQLMMTPRELRDELREQEGAPEIKARRRAVGRQLAAQRAAQGKRQ